jgi:hypothetical protein
MTHEKINIGLNAKTIMQMGKIYSVSSECEIKFLSYQFYHQLKIKNLPIFNPKNVV